MLIAVAADGTLSYNTTDCDVLTGKFGAARNRTDGSDANHRSFKGEVSISEGGGDAIVKVGYYDGDFYNNASFYGFVTEDGKTPATTCLDLRVYRYGANFTNPVLVSDLVVTGSHDDVTNYRYYVLTFKGNDFKTRLTETAST
jgi:hypothetical protein